jgi:Zn-finger nucleic acid-binding protein
LFKKVPFGSDGTGVSAHFWDNVGNLGCQDLSSMQCPKCYGETEQVISSGDDTMRIDRCLLCHGMYIDQLTREDFGTLETLINVDSGDVEVGSEYDEMVYVECPKCDKIMDQRLLETPVRIRFELCPSCHSTFLDAGELRLYLSKEYRQAFEELLPQR